MAAGKVNSRQKGKVIERKAAAFLTGLGYPARRTAQVRGNNDGAADIECPSLDCHIEVKGDRSIGLGTKALDDACEQAARDANGKDWVVLWWEHKKGWRLTWDARGRMTVAARDIGPVLEMFKKRL